MRFAMASADGAEGVREAAKRGPSLQIDGTLYAAWLQGLFRLGRLGCTMDARQARRDGDEGPRAHASAKR
ncbi:hypothetical protein Slu03_11020 [Sediminihabitans luteus]|nr:hypothetical protein Slu03_11020 [Sediminihabitans luteus]